MNLNLISVNMMNYESKHYRQLINYCYLLDLKDDACQFLKYLNGPGEDSLERRRRKETTPKSATEEDDDNYVI